MTIDEMLAELPGRDFSFPTHSKVPKEALIEHLYYMKKAEEVFDRYPNKEWGVMLQDLSDWRTRLIFHPESEM